MGEEGRQGVKFEEGGSSGGRVGGGARQGVEWERGVVRG